MNLIKNILITNKLKNLIQQNQFSRSRLHYSSVMQPATRTDVAVEEIRIEVPWGHIAAKWWGPKNIRPVLALHGWQDNAGSFDNLIPLLPTHLSYLVIDLPGHGLSSRIPNGLLYSSMDFLIIVRLLQKKYQWEKMSILAHSMGAIITFLYGSSFPNECDFIIGLDALKPHIRNAEKSVKSLIEGVDKFLLFDERNTHETEPPIYEYETAVERYCKGTDGSVTPDAAKILLQRGLNRSVKDPNKFYFSRDYRLNALHFYRQDQQVSIEMAKRITAPYMFVKALKSPYYEDKKYFDEIIEVLREHNPKFEFLQTDSTHHFHLTDPTVISSQLSRFINQHRPLSNDESKTK